MSTLSGFRARPRLAGLILAAALAGCAPSEAPDRASARSAAPAASEQAVSIVPVTASELLAEVGERHSPVTLINVWATWCAPCRAEFPALLAVAERYRARGLRVMFVSADFDTTAPREFLQQHGVSGRTYLKSGPDMEFIDAIDPRWSGALPATVVFDASGKKTDFWEGAADEARFAAAIDRALPPPAP
jgi:thiol-disulfide isomerase/thioredoxin